MRPFAMPTGIRIYEPRILMRGASGPTGSLLSRPFRRLVLATAALLLGTVVAACGGGERNDSTLTVGFRYGFASFDPLLNPAFTADFLLPVYDTLIVRKGQDVFKPGLATGWKYDPAALTMTLTLRTGVSFSDGTSFDAKAVKANFERGMSEKAGPWSSVFAAFDSVKVTADSKVVVHLKEPLPSIVSDLAFIPGMMVSPAALQNAGALKNEPVGTGPWVLDSEKVRPGDTYPFVKNDHYWDPGAKVIDTYVMKVITDRTAAGNALRAKQVDLIGSDGLQTVQLKREGFSIGSTGSMAYVVDIADRAGKVVPALGDVRVRRAIGLALDRQALLDAVFGGYGSPSSTIFPDGTVGFSAAVNNGVTYNLDLAKALMRQAGYEKGFSVKVFVMSSNENIAAAVAGSLAKIGIKLEITPVADAGTFAATVADKKSPILIVASGLRSPWELYTAFGGATGRYNPFGVTADGIDAAARAVTALADPTSAKAAEGYGNLMEELIMTHAFIQPLFTVNTPVAMQTKVKAELGTQAQTLPDPRTTSKD
ncbi:ABC transporter substrate-binding protein [Actinomadura sp. 3N508]|uniref:ABC transporter substrate-binding protein n=1 Tax=Actinomadura sp. 3N508 TaxID=3375153 RepID=UPI00379FD28F